MGLRFAQNSIPGTARLNFDGRDFDGTAVTASDSTDLPNGINDMHASHGHPAA